MGGAANEALSLEQEADMLRALIRRLYAMSSGVESVDELMVTLRAVGVASTRLAALLRAQKSLLSGNGEALATINQAIQQVNDEMAATDDR